MSEAKHQPGTESGFLSAACSGEQPVSANLHGGSQSVQNESVVMVDITPDEVAELRSKAAKADEFWDRYVRAAADLENYRKRATREKTEATQFATESLLRQLLPVLDNFEMALAAGDGTTPNSDALRSGVGMICNQLRQVLSNAGVEIINATGQAFDPNLHEAVALRETAEVAEGHVLQQVRKGYRLHQRLLRPASVVVAKTPSACAPTPEFPA